MELTAEFMENSMDFEIDYKVRFFQDTTWEVYSVEEECVQSHFQGSLTDCEAWIRLTERGYMG